ncbi:transporter [Herbaspirillum sp. SJZ107]|uniref:SphA family protein n=1 Tax=Herbaspirillum sp. SJZ107 TaxID=2572881 RepID=UPI00114FF747|nr:transporter [Herbaspirillum sp. SJZ107]TQK01100.1 hypothetical protein FBX97_5613 [Herbaspirillum sp. SJZ107]
MKNPYLHMGRVLLAGAALVATAASATEGGGSSYPMGAENYLTGAMPPPGFYTLAFINHYSGDELKDGAGNTLPVDFSVRATAISPRFVWVTGNTLFGGQVAHAIIVPLVDLHVDVAGAGSHKRGLGDITISALALGYHHSEHLHSVAAVDIITPTGSYDRNRLANPGRNYWAIEPVYTASYIDPAGWNGDVKLMYDFNHKNKDTDYRSGQEAHMDYSLGYAVAPNWVLGVGGYVYRQTTGDELHGVDVGNKGRAFAIGPSIKYDTGKGFFVTAKFETESGVRNRAQGRAFWIKATIPL